MTGRRAEPDVKACACGQTFATLSALYDHTDAALRVTPDNSADHPHRVSQRKDQLLRHVTTAHPFGSVHGSPTELKHLSAEEVRSIHHRLHEGGA